LGRRPRADALDPDDCVILIDTSAWVEFLRGTGSAVCDEVDRLLSRKTAITDPIVMEILAGARDERHLHGLRGLLGRSSMVSCAPGDYVHAALLYRQCRQGGATVRRLLDCLIASVALREQIPILHNDADFDVLARHTGLRIHSA
jgi:predicted nucleic acid-binding protein